MRTRTAVILCIGICSLSVLLPLGIFRVQDSVAADKDVSWESSTEDIARKYPIVSSVYANFYQKNNSSDSYESYDLSSMEAYSQTRQKELEEVKKKYSSELNTMLANGVIPYELLEMKQQETYTVSFGTLSYSHTKGGTWQLSQVYRLNTQNDHIQDFTMDKQTGKILNFDFYTSNMKQYSAKERKELAWNMITYLGLDSIQDWTYTQYGYESYEAKIQVYCEEENTGEATRFDMGITPLGQHTNATIYKYIQY